MTAKFLVLSCVLALGCAGSHPQEPAVATAKAPLKKKPQHTGLAQSTQSMAQTESVVVSRTKEGGVGLHGPEGAYIERVDNSGWSGVSKPAAEPPPTAVGGGPAPSEPSPED